MAARQILRLLDDLAALVMSVDAESYRARPLPGISGSIGEHIRHSLDHIAALVAVRPAETLTYDRRDRGTHLERDPAEALRQILRLKAVVDRGMRPIDEPLRVSSKLSASGESIVGWSTVGREVAFVTSHTIHHQALIAALMAILGLSVSDGLGYAPSTPRQAV